MMEDVPQDLVAHLHQNADVLADKTCLHILSDDSGAVDRITYSELWLKACGFAIAFEAAGVGPGNVVLIFLNHHPDMAACYFGVMQAGAIPSFMPCPSTKQHPERYWSAHRTLFQRIDPKAIVTDSAQAEEMKRFGLVIETTCFIDVNTVDAADAPFSPKPTDPDQIALLQHSSGTTGLKKGMALSHRAILNQIRSYADTIMLSEDDTIISWLPLYHDMGLITSLIMPLALGRTTVLMNPFQWTVRPGMLFETIARYDGRLVWMPNFAFEHLCRTTGRIEPFADLSQVRAFINCSEPCKMETFHRFADTFSEWGVRPDQLQACYALAENVFAVSQTTLGQELNSTSAPSEEALKPRPIASVGQVMPGVELRIQDQNGDLLSEGEVGEIAIRGNSLFTEYFMLEDETSDRMRNGYFLTRDLGFQKDGELFILGRRDDLIIINGRNHYAHDLEALANEIVGLKHGRSAAFGLFNERLGSEEAVIVAERSQDTGEKDLKRTLKEKIFDEADLVIRDAYIVDTDWLVKTSSGKVSREANKAKYLSEKEMAISDQ
jgi:fatty-acyl-CoA synthase